SLVVAFTALSLASCSSNDPSASSASAIEFPRAAFDMLVSIGKEKVDERERVGRPYDTGSALLDDIFRDMAERDRAVVGDVERLRTGVSKLLADTKGLASADATMAELKALQRDAASGLDPLADLQRVTSDVNRALNAALGGS